MVVAERFCEGPPVARQQPSCPPVVEELEVEPCCDVRRYTMTRMTYRRDRAAIVVVARPIRYGGPVRLRRTGPRAAALRCGRPGLVARHAAVRAVLLGALVEQGVRVTEQRVQL